jgi:hypothetical protein
MEQWLIRTAKNWITGPYSKEQVCKKIQEGSLELQDEVCPSNGYWILLHERKEIFDQLGVEVPRAENISEDVTENEIDVSSNEISEEKVLLPEPSSTTIARPPSQPSRVSPSRIPDRPLGSIESDEKIQSNKGLSFILIGAVLLVIIAIRAFRH